MNRFWFLIKFVQNKFVISNQIVCYGRFFLLANLTGQKRSSGFDARLSKMEGIATARKERDKA